MAGMELLAPSHWRCLEFISDVHLQESDRKTFHAWAGYMQSTRADAVFILGDLFEVWVGDDALQSGNFEVGCADILRACGERLNLYVMHGNRDFLMGPALIQACHATALPDPSVLVFAGQRWLLSHGDALCTEDHEYQAFREKVRSAAWQQEFLALPLPDRQGIARDMRKASDIRKQGQTDYADVTAKAALQALQNASSNHLLHGHTHKPAQHWLDNNCQRSVLSDWDLNAQPARAEVLQLSLLHHQPVLKRLNLDSIATTVG